MFVSMVHIVSVIIVIISSISLLMFHHVNKYKQVDRFFYYDNKYLYILLQLCYYLVFLSFVLNSRFLVYELIMYVTTCLYPAFSSSSTSTS